MTAALTLCVSLPASAEENPPAADDKVAYYGKLPPIEARLRGTTPRDNTHMVTVSGQKYGRQSVVASVDQWRNDRKQIDVTFTE